jgi:hypothetical protein
MYLRRFGGWSTFDDVCPQLLYCDRATIRHKRRRIALAQDLFYLASYKNVDKLFQKIEAAKAPEVFTNAFLTDTIGLKSTTDRPLINMLKKLGFLDATGRPTENYGLLKNKAIAKAAIADGLRKVYKPLFDANEKANELKPEELKGLIAQVTGSEKNIVANIAYTFNAIAKEADFSKSAKLDATKKDGDKGGDDAKAIPPIAPSGLRTDFHFNIQVHLPANGTEETYLNIFNALRRTFS